MANKLIDLSYLDPAISSEPWNFYELLHKECPVYQMPETGAFLVTRYDDLRQVLKDTGTFSSNVQVAARGETAELQQSILIKGGGWEHVQTLQRTAGNRSDSILRLSIEKPCYNSYPQRDHTVLASCPGWNRGKPQWVIQPQQKNPLS